MLNKSQPLKEQSQKLNQIRNRLSNVQKKYFFQVNAFQKGKSSRLKKIEANLYHSLCSKV
jgi:hypothetical protein